MKKTKRLLMLVLSLVFALGAVIGFVGCGGTTTVGKGTWVTPEIPPEQIVEPPAAVNRVYSVTMQYNKKNIDGGMLSVDLSAGKISVTAAVSKDADADGTVRFDSSDKTVATITDGGEITLLRKGETELSASAGGKTHRVVLVVNDSHTVTPAKHTVTVNGGTSSVSAAAAGEYVTVSTVIPEHKDFTEWVFPNTVTWINGNVFKMPDADVEITAEFIDMLYTLNVVGATVTKAGLDTDVEGADGGYTNDDKDEKGNNRNLPEYAITTYSLPYDTAIDLKAIAEPAGKIFVGWDYGSQDNRRGELGETELSFGMPDETFTVWAIYSALTPKVLTESIGDFATSAIDAGVITGADAADPALEGLSGYRIAIPAGFTYNTSGYTTENIQGSVLDSIRAGTQYMKAIFRNNGTEAVTVEVYASYYGILATSGAVTVQGGETKKVFFTAGMGINKPWMGFAVRENTASTAVELDMVLGMASMYPKGDKQLSVTGGPQYVRLKGEQDYYAGDSIFKIMGTYAREKFIYNKLGTTYIINYANASCVGEGSAISSPIVNMPAFDAQNPRQTIYGKYINLATNAAVSIKTTLRLVISTSDDPVANPDSIVASKDILSEEIGDMQMFKFEFTRTEGTQYYFAVIKDARDAGGTYDANSYCLQMVYNNCIGYEEA